MIKSIAFLIVLVAITGLLWFANLNYPYVYLEKGFYTFFALTVIHLVLKIALENTGFRRIKESKTRYSFRKAISIVYFIVLLVVVVRIWVEDTQTLLVSYGLIAAGITIALQDFFKNFVGGIIIFTTGTYRVGDRVEINSKFGDIIDIGIFYTTFLELKEWVEAEQPTGRISMVPNGMIISGVINNYTKDNNFMWDEVSLPLTYNSNWKEAITKINDICIKETKNMAEQAEKEMSKLGEKYYLTKRAVDPEIYIKLTDNWINLHIRYVTDVRQRRVIRNKISQAIIEEIQNSKNIEIASTTFDIVGFPELKITKDSSTT